MSTLVLLLYVYVCTSTLVGLLLLYLYSTAVTSVDLFLLYIYLNFRLTVKGPSPGIKYTDNMYIIEYKSWLFHLE